MSYDKYMLMYYIALALFIVFLLLTIVLFFVLKIPKAIGDLTGLTEKKAIQMIQKQNEEIKKMQSAGNVTDRISQSGRIIPGQVEGTIVTEKINTEQINPRVISSSDETMVLADSNNAETTVLADSNNAETMVLTQTQNFETIVLKEHMQQLNQEDITVPLKLEKNGFANETGKILFVHTTECII